MGNGVSIEQGNLPSYGIRDVSDAADRKQYDWSQLTEAPITEQPRYTLSSPRNPYSYMNFIMLRIYAEALDGLRVRLNMYLVTTMAITPLNLYQFLSVWLYANFMFAQEVTRHSVQTKSESVQCLSIK